MAVKEDTMSNIGDTIAIVSRSGNVRTSSHNEVSNNLMTFDMILWLNASRCQ